MCSVKNQITSIVTSGVVASGLYISSIIILWKTKVEVNPRAQIPYKYIPTTILL